MTVTPLRLVQPEVNAQDAARAYRSVDSGATNVDDNSDFGGLLARAVEGAVQAGHAAEAQAMQGIATGGNLTDVVQAVSRAELALQTATAVRDRMVQAYQDIMRMPI